MLIMALFILVWTKVVGILTNRHSHPLSQAASMAEKVGVTGTT